LEHWQSLFKVKTNKLLGYSGVVLEGRYEIIRKEETNLGNFLADLMRLEYKNVDCSILNTGAIRVNR
jgi:5'-nucleotidase